MEGDVGRAARAAFVLGVCSGVVLVTKWRSLLKSGIKAGVRGGTTAREVVVKAMENVADVAYEARSELDRTGQQVESPVARAAGTDGRGNGAAVHRMPRPT